MKIYILFVCLVSTSLAWASLPQNRLQFPITKSKSTGDNFYNTVKLFSKIWNPIIKKSNNKDLFIAADWQDPSVNASMTRDMQDNPVMTISGGIARHPDMNMDSFLFIMCHELGHYMGGAPKAFRGRSELRSWSSVEGQADYFAASKCLRITFNEIKSSGSILKSYKQEDVVESKTICSSLLCSRIVLSGLSAGKLFAAVTNHSTRPELYTRSTKVAWETLQTHPEPQCRVDTIIAGALCNIDPQTPFSDKEIYDGACKIGPGARPFCWFNIESY